MSLLSSQSTVLGATFVMAMLFSSSSAHARSCRVNLTPNGSKFQCQTCHTGSNGGPRNAFGSDVQAIVRTSTCQTIFWSPTLAAKDSDGDGRTNGEELGDPEGTWESGDPRPGDVNLVTQPGVKDFPAAILTAIEPPQVARDGTTAVSIRGINFRAETTVRIGRYALTNIQLVSPELITALAPALGISEPGGAKDASVANGTQRFTLKAAVTYPDLPPLAVTSAEPSRVLRDGTTLLTVTGENFLADTKIRIGTRDLVNPSAPSADGKTITGLAPALGATEALGPRDVIATDGRGRVTLAAGVTYADAEPEGARFIRGDFDGSGQLRLEDAAGTLNLLFAGGPPGGCSAAGDANDDGKVDISDAVFTLRFLFLGGASPAPPYPECGPRAVEDLDCGANSSCP